jgi:hypothetical protein
MQTSWPTLRRVLGRLTLAVNFGLRNLELFLRQLEFLLEVIGFLSSFGTTSARTR